MFTREDAQGRHLHSDSPANRVTLHWINCSIPFSAIYASNVPLLGRLFLLVLSDCSLGLYRGVAEDFDHAFSPVFPSIINPSADGAFSAAWNQPLCFPLRRISPVSIRRIFFYLTENDKFRCTYMSLLSPTANVCRNLLVERAHLSARCCSSAKLFL